MPRAKEAIKDVCSFLGRKWKACARLRYFYPALGLLVFLLVFFLWLDLNRFTSVEDRQYFKSTKTTPPPPDGWKRYLDGKRMKNLVKLEFPQYPTLRVVVHLDLKGAPLSLKYLQKEVLSHLKAGGANTLLIEYEDMFPFEGKLSGIAAENAYSKSDLQNFLLYCEQEGFEVIPLIQTFGHMEYVLKLEEYKRLREVEDSAGEICPSKPESKILIEEMLTQVLNLHSIVQVKRIHIGCDEVHNLNSCAMCRERGVTKSDIFVGHVRSIYDFLKKNYPDVKALMWDDMMRYWPDNVMRTSKLYDYIEPVVWDYTDQPNHSIDSSTWHMYYKYFEKIWVAGAFKGASSPSSILPDMRTRYDNHIGWLHHINHNFPSNLKLIGYVFTGWSRYDHFASLCELFPAAFPSLALGLTVVMNGLVHKVDVRQFYFELMGCNRAISEREDIFFDSKKMVGCHFSGTELFTSFSQFPHHRHHINSLYDELYENDAWMTKYHIEQNYTYGWKVRQRFKDTKFDTVLSRFRNWRQDLKEKLRHYYTDAIINEWFQQHVDVYSDKLEFLRENYQKALRSATWKKRETY